MPNRDAERRLDRRWDDLVAGSRSPGGGEEDAVLRRLHAAAFHVPGAAAAERRVWQRLQAQGETSVHAHAQPRPVPRFLSPRLRLPVASPSARAAPRPLAALGTALLVLLVGAGSFFALRAAAPSGGRDGDPPTLYLAPWQGDPIRPLDRTTLLDRGASTGGLAFDPVDCPTWVASADGSTVVGLLDPCDGSLSREVTVVVLDGETLTERARFEVLEPDISAAPLLSADGRRLVLEKPGRVSVPEAIATPSWAVYDTTDGRLVAAVNSAHGVVEPARGLDQVGWLDPAGRRLYRLAFPGDDAPMSGPRRVHVVAHDLETGAEVDRLVVPGVEAGYWYTERSDSRPARATFRFPARAISPDGRQIALVHATGEAVTLVATDPLRVERTLPLDPPLAFGSAADATPDPSGLEVEPDVINTGRAPFAAYAADGRGLYLTAGHHVLGFLGGYGLDGTLPLQRVDLASGATVATAPLLPEWLLVAEGGTDLYAVTIESGGLAVHRLDAETLEIRETRLLPPEEAGQLLLLPSVPQAIQRVTGAFGSAIG